MTSTPVTCEPDAAYRCTSWPRSHEPAREVGHERLRTAELRLAYRRDERRDDRQPHARDHLVRDVARRVDAEQRVRDAPRAAVANRRSPRADGISRSARQPPRGSRTRGTCLRRSSRGGSRARRASRGCWATRSRRDRPGGRRAPSPQAPLRRRVPASGVNAEQVTTRSAKSSASGSSSKKPSITRARSPRGARDSFSSNSSRNGAAGSIAQTARARSSSSSVSRPAPAPISTIRSTPSGSHATTSG